MGARGLRSSPPSQGRRLSCNGIHLCHYILRQGLSNPELRSLSRLAGRPAPGPRLSLPFPALGLWAHAPSSLCKCSGSKLRSCFRRSASSPEPSPATPRFLFTKGQPFSMSLDDRYKTRTRNVLRVNHSIKSLDAAHSRPLQLPLFLECCSRGLSRESLFTMDRSHRALDVSSALQRERPAALTVTSRQHQ